MEEILEKDGEDIRSCIINIPKPRIYGKISKSLITVCTGRNILKSRKDNRFEKPTASALKKYSLPEAKPIRAKNCGRDQILLSFRQFARQEHSIRHRQRMAIKRWEEYRIRSTDLRKRLYLESEPNDVIALTDIDTDFFNFINGRPLVSRTGSYKSTLYFFNYRLMKKIEVGYRHDTILNIDANFKREQRQYEVAIKRCKDQVKYLDKFISEDYQKSMACLERWEEVKNKVVSKNVELEGYALDMFTITSRLVCLDYIYCLQQKYGRFLYYLSSPSWRAQNREFAQSIEIEAKGFDLGGESREEDTFSQIFEKMQKECAGKFIKPAIYFHDPAELIGIFGAIEMQQHYQFAHASRMAPLIKLLHIGIQILKDQITQESAAVASSIEGFETQIKFYTERSNQLKAKFFKVLHGLFYESVGTWEVLKFYVHLGFCYEKVFNDKPINLDITIMAKTLERTYLDYHARLENFCSDSVKTAIKECVKQEKIKNKKAKEAARELRLFERLEHELRISFAPVVKRDGKVVSGTRVGAQFAENGVTQQKKRVVKVKTKIPSKSTQKSLTDSEIEYLRLFTDWNETDDPNLYLHTM